MNWFNRPGAFRYMLLAVVLRSASSGFEAMGDRAYATEGGGAALPFHLLALVLLLAAFGFFVFSLKRMLDRAKGKHRLPDPGGDRPQDLAALRQVFDDERPFDPDAALARYQARQAMTGAPADPEPSPAPRPGGFGRKGL